MTIEIATARIRTPGELIKAGEALANSWFRGQGDFEWGLKSTIERDASIFEVPKEILFNRENVMLNLFKQRAHLYSNGTNLPETEFEWHALIRHHGGPSRLLDITSSYLVAAYFALNDSQPDRDAALWAFHGESHSKDKISDIFSSSSGSGITIRIPDQLNARINAQSGGFLIPHSFEDTLEEQVGKKFDVNLKEIKKYRSVKRVKTERDHRIWKFKIPRDKHSELFRFLSRCNIRSYSLVPGIDGLALSLREMMRVYD
ncbi:MAG: FRG domain-containing protein [Sedimenticola sp.]